MSRTLNVFIFLIIEHESIEPRRDSFRFQVRDAVANRSPIVQLDIVIEVNSETKSFIYLYLIELTLILFKYYR